jgi:hypothetical protein
MSIIYWHNLETDNDANNLSNYSVDIQGISGYSSLTYDGLIISQTPYYYYKLDEISGNPQDSSGNGFHAINTYGTLGYGDEPLHYEDISSVQTISGFIEQDENLTITPCTERSVSMWFKADSYSPTSYNFIYDESGAGRGFIVYLYEGKLYLCVWDNNYGGSSYRFYEGPTIIVGKNYHLVFTWDSSTTTHKTYIDGILVNTITDTVPIINDRNNSESGIGALHTSAKTHIGNLNTGGGYDYNFEGKISNVATWQRVLTDNEITEQYTRGNGFNNLDIALTNTGAGANDNWTMTNDLDNIGDLIVSDLYTGIMNFASSTITMNGDLILTTNLSAAVNISYNQDSVIYFNGENLSAPKGCPKLVIDNSPSITLFGDVACNGITTTPNFIGNFTFNNYDLEASNEIDLNAANYLLSNSTNIVLTDNATNIDFGQDMSVNSLSVDTALDTVNLFNDYYLNDMLLGDSSSVYNISGSASLIVGDNISYLDSVINTHTTFLNDVILDGAPSVVINVEDTQSIEFTSNLEMNNTTGQYFSISSSASISGGQVIFNGVNPKYVDSTLEVSGADLVIENLPDILIDNYVAEISGFTFGPYDFSRMRSDVNDNERNFDYFCEPSESARHLRYSTRTVSLNTNPLVPIGSMVSHPTTPHTYTQSEAQTDASKLIYDIVFPQSGTWRVAITATSVDGGSRDIALGLDGVIITTLSFAGSSNSVTNYYDITVPTTGIHQFEIYNMNCYLSLEQITISEDLTLSDLDLIQVTNENRFIDNQPISFYEHSSIVTRINSSNTQYVLSNDITVNNNSRLCITPDTSVGFEGTTVSYCAIHYMDNADSCFDYSNASGRAVLLNNILFEGILDTINNMDFENFSNGYVEMFGAFTEVNTSILNINLDTSIVSPLFHIYGDNRNFDNDMYIETIGGGAVGSISFKNEFSSNRRPLNLTNANLIFDITSPLSANVLKLAGMTSSGVCSIIATAPNAVYLCRNNNRTHDFYDIIDFSNFTSIVAENRNTNIGIPFNSNLLSNIDLSFISSGDYDEVSIDLNFFYNEGIPHIVTLKTINAQIRNEQKYRFKSDDDITFIISDLSNCSIPPHNIIFNNIKLLEGDSLIVYRSVDQGNNKGIFFRK